MVGNIERLLLAALISVPLTLWGKEGVFITFEPLKDWKPKITLEGNVGGGDLKVEYKLFGTTRLRYKLFNSLTAGLKFKGLSLPEWNLKPDSKLMAIVRGFEGRRGRRAEGGGENEPILCSSNGKSLFCPLGREGKETFIPIGRSFRDFTLILDGEVVRESCTPLRLESTPGFPWLAIGVGKNTLRFKVGDKEISVPFTGRRLKLALLKGDEEITLLLGEGISYTLTGAKVVYLHRAVLDESCLRNWKLYLYPSAKGRETIFLTLFGD